MKFNLRFKHSYLKLFIDVFSREDAYYCGGEEWPASSCNDKSLRGQASHFCPHMCNQCQGSSKNKVGVNGYCPPDKYW